jgi:hypothetical protein
VAEEPRVSNLSSGRRRGVEMPEDKAFRIMREIAPLSLVFAGPPSGEWQIDASSPGWEKLAATNAFLATEEIDLQGITRQDLTMFFANNYTQRAAPYSCNLTVDSTYGGVEIVDNMVVSDVPLKDIRNVPVSSIKAGFNVSPDDYMTLKLAEGVIFTQTSNAPNTMVMTDSFSYASGDPSASDKVYLYRWIQIHTDFNLPPLPDGTTIVIPAKRYVGTGITTEEPELVWMMRLKRSFEIQETAVHD